MGRRSHDAWYSLGSISTTPTKSISYCYKENCTQIPQRCKIPRTAIMKTTDEVTSTRIEVRFMGARGNRNGLGNIEMAHVYGQRGLPGFQIASPHSSLLTEILAGTSFQIPILQKIFILAPCYTKTTTSTASRVPPSPQASSAAGNARQYPNISLIKTSIFNAIPDTIPTPEFL